VRRTSNILRIASARSTLQERVGNSLTASGALALCVCDAAV
jgi:hypothetical protein